MDRPKLPDFPLFSQPGLVRAFCTDPSMICGPDAFGAAVKIADVRGWGYLTGQGRALALDHDTAYEAQKRTGQFIIDAINEKLVRDGHIMEASDAG